MNIARFLANVVGKAHARQMDEDTRSKWAKELSRARSGDLKAPSWLWSSVVDLIAIHEKAILAELAALTPGGMPSLYKILEFRAKKRSVKSHGFLTQKSGAN
jgi:hypothetical protein